MMIRRVVRMAGLVAAVAGVAAASAKMYTDYMPAKGVWEVNAINVDPNHVDDYLVGLKRTQIPGFEVLKRRGLVDDYKLLIRNGYTKDNPTVLIMVHFTSVSALEPNRARDEAIEKEMMAQMPEDAGKAAVAGYEKYRTFVDDAYYGEVAFPK